MSIWRYMTITWGYEMLFIWAHGLVSRSLFPMFDYLHIADAPYLLRCVMYAVTRLCIFVSYKLMQTPGYLLMSVFQGYLHDMSPEWCKMVQKKVDQILAFQNKVYEMYVNLRSYKVCRENFAARLRPPKSSFWMQSSHEIGRGFVYIYFLSKYQLFWYTVLKILLLWLCVMIGSFKKMFCHQECSEICMWLLCVINILIFFFFFFFFFFFCLSMTLP